MSLPTQFSITSITSFFLGFLLVSTATADVAMSSTPSSEFSTSTVTTESVTVSSPQLTTESVITTTNATPTFQTTEPHIITTTATVITTSSTVNNTIVTTCNSSGVSLPPAPVQVTPDSSEEGYILRVDFGSVTPGVKKSCSWSIDALDNGTSNAVSFLFPTPGDISSWCGNSQNELVFYDQDPRTGNLTYVDDACKRYRPTNSSAGTAGSPSYQSVPPSSASGPTQIPTGLKDGRTIVKFVATNLTERSLPLLKYSSFPWPNGHCGVGANNESSTLKATEQAITLVVPDSAHRLPNTDVCTWDIGSADPKNVVHIRIVSRGRDEPMLTSAGSGSELATSASGDIFVNAEDDNRHSLFYILVPGSPVHDADLTIQLTDKGLDFQQSGIAGSVIMALQVGDQGGAPPFNLTYWADPFDQLCPLVSSPKRLNATTEWQAFKGVNHPLNQPAVDSNCSWVITTPTEGMVVQLIKIYNIDYLAYVNDDDYLNVNELKIDMTDNAAFPFWSSGRSAAISFHVSSKTSRSQFIITYKSVPAGKCQGHPIELTVSENVTTVSEFAINANDTLSGTDCRWLIRTNSVATGGKVRVVVRLINQSVDCTNSSYVWGRTYTLAAYSSTTRSFFNTIPPTCLPGNASWVVTSQPQDDVMMIAFNRDPKVSYVRTGVTVEVSFVPHTGPTGGVAAVVARNGCGVVVLMMFSVVFLVLRAFA